MNPRVPPKGQQKFNFCLFDFPSKKDQETREFKRFLFFSLGKQAGLRTLDEFAQLPEHCAQAFLASAYLRSVPSNGFSTVFFRICWYLFSKDFFVDRNLLDLLSLIFVGLVLRFD